MASNVEGFFRDPEMRDVIERLGGTDVVSDAFLVAELGVMGVVASAYGIQAAMRLRAEEAALHAEALLATAVTRLRWAASHAVVALVGTTVVLVAAGLAVGVAHAVQTREAGQVGRVLAAALVQAPAAWVLVGIVVLAFGLVPRLTNAGWVFLVGFFLLGELGPLFELDEWVLDLSPYSHVPRMPVAGFEAGPVLWLTAVAAVLVAAGLTAFRRRDVG